MLIWNILFYLGIFGTSLMSFGLISILIENNLQELAPGFSAWLIFGILPLIIGFLKRKQVKIKQLEAQKVHRHTSLLRLAKAHQGILSTSEVALSLGVSIDEARDVLEEAVANGICTVEIDDNGNLDYIFRDLISN